MLNDLKKLKDDAIREFKKVKESEELRNLETKYLGRKGELTNLLRKVKHHTDSLVGLKIAVMGCIVNGPGEMLGADYGLVGSSKGYLNLYKKGKIVSKRIPQDEAVKALTDLIKLSGDWND